MAFGGVEANAEIIPCAVSIAILKIACFCFVLFSLLAIFLFTLL
jgi:hypothetical protein